MATYFCLCIKRHTEWDNIKFRIEFFMVKKNFINVYFDEVSCVIKNSVIYLYKTSFTAFTTSSLLGIQAFNKTGEYGAGVSAVVILLIGASK